MLGLPVLGLVVAAHTRLDPESTGVLVRLSPYHLALFASTALLMPLVRAGGMGVEQALPVAKAPSGRRRPLTRRIVAA